MAHDKKALGRMDSPEHTRESLSLLADTVSKRAGRRPVLALSVLTPLFALLTVLVGIHGP